MKNDLLEREIKKTAPRERVPLHRDWHGPRFPAGALMAPLGPSPFAPLRLSTAFESQWTQIVPETQCQDHH